MRSTTVVDRVQFLLEQDPATLDREALSVGLGELKRVRGWVDASVMAYTRRLQQIEQHDHDASTSQSLVDDAGQTGREAGATKDRTSLCDEHGDLEESLAEGELTAAHLDVIARHAKKLRDAERADFDAKMPEIRSWAQSETVEVLEMRVKRLVRAIQAEHAPESAADELERQREMSSIKSWVDKDNGLHKFLVAMDPVRAAKFLQAHRAELNRLRASTKNSAQSWGSVQVDALLVAMAGDAGEGRSRVPEIVVLVDDTTLLAGEHPAGTCETIDGAPVPVETIRQMCAEATLAVAVTNPHGVVREVVRRRTATWHQRTEIAAMYATCAFPNCTVSVADCRAHHVTFHRHGGKTTVPNLLPVCEQHHHTIHDGGWSVRLDPMTRAANWVPPNGAQLVITRPDRRPATRQPQVEGSDAPSHAILAGR